MKKLLVAGIAATAFCGAPVLAADMPAKAPIYKAPVSTALSWTGFYLGAGGGYGSWVDPKSTIVGENIDKAVSGKGGFGTIIAGFDYQVADRWVAGVYADFDLAALNGTVHNEGPLYTGARDVRRAWFAGGRVGYLLMPSSLLYATGGYTEARFSSTTLNSSLAPLFTPGLNSLPGNTSSGWYVGTGIETQISDGWSLRGEYRYADYRTSQPTEAIIGVDTYGLHPTVQTFRVDLAYKFGQQRVAIAQARPAAASWTGFYLGGGAGYGSWEDPHSSGLRAAGALNLVNIPAGGKGGFLSVVTGYDYQFANRVVAGVYTDYDFANIKGMVNDDDPGTSARFTESGAWFAGGRIGYLVMPASLAYVTGGYTEARFSAGQSHSATTGAPAPTFQIPGKTFSGGYIGGGLETQIGGNWSLRGEYRYAGYNKQILPEGTSVFEIALRPAVQTFRVDLTYKFGG
jgi:outer membrane immunogenic protein